MLVLCHVHWVIFISGILLQLNLPLKVPPVVMIFCHLVGLLWPTEATFTLDDGVLLLMYLVRMATTVLKSFSYLSGCAMTVVTAVDNLSHILPFNMFHTFDPGSRPWYPYSIRFPRIMCYLTCWVIYIYQFHASSCCHTSTSAKPSQLLTLLHWHGLGLTIWSV